MPTPVERIMAKVTVEPNGCWLVPLPRGSRYARVTVAGRRVGAHRVMYEAMVAPIPDGLVLDHLCRVPACVNPDHLEPVTQAVNIARSEASIATINAAKTRCVNGHEYAETGVYLLRDGGRRCAECSRQQTAAYQRRKKDYC